MADLRFYADENISKAIISGIRRRDIPIISTPEAGNLGISDKDHFKYASTGRYVILTKDDDFLKLASLGESHAGIAYAKPGISIGHIRKIQGQVGHYPFSCLLFTALATVDPPIPIYFPISIIE